MIQIAAGLLAISLGFAATASELDLSPYRGKVVYLDFWASWCAPCRQSFPWMADLQRQYASEDFVVVAVNVDQDRDSADRFLNDVPSNFKIIYDPRGELATTFKVSGMPSAVLIDRTGHVRFQHVGFSSKKKDQYEEQLHALLAESAP
jgi:thiol-disulfide isomerase/thioredoxin